MSRFSSVAPSPVLAKIARGNLCAGCGLCENLAAPGRIAMRVDDAGYLRPQVKATLSPEEDAAIARLCPGLSLTQDRARGERHPLWGTLISTRVGYATDARLRHHASSGGALSAVIGFLLDTGAVDAVIQTAADPDRPIANRTVESVSLDDVYRAAGSRYAPSAPLAGLRSYLERPGRFAFVGKPCDVAALRAYGREDRRVAERFPFILSFFCAGVPSLAGPRAILDHLGLTETEVVAFRYRGDGWPGCAAAMTADGRTMQMGYDESWGRILTRYVQFRCKICPDGTGGFADLVCADAWYGDERGFPVFADAPGRSLIVTRTATGEDLLRRAEAAGFLVTEPIDVAAITAMQPGQHQRKALALSRLAALALLRRPRPRYKGFDLAGAARQASMPKHLRSFLGMVRRSLSTSSSKT